MAKRIVIANQKGGVGRTTTAVTLAHGLARAGQRVLLVDCDPQGQVTSFLGLEKSAGLYEWLMERAPLVEVVVPASTMTHERPGLLCYRAINSVRRPKSC